MLVVFIEEKKLLLYPKRISHTLFIGWMDGRIDRFDRPIHLQYVNHIFIEPLLVITSDLIFIQINQIYFICLYFKLQQ